MREINQIIVHCAATRPSMDIGAAEIDRWHRDRGWAGIGYHFVVRRSGAIEFGRDMRRSGAHARGFNSDSIGICLVGGVNDDMQPEDNYTANQLIALELLIRGLQAKYGIPSAAVCGHRDLPRVHKACPCIDIGAIVEEYGASRI